MIKSVIYRDLKLSNRFKLTLHICFGRLIFYMLTLGQILALKYNNQIRITIIFYSVATIDWVRLFNFVKNANIKHEQLMYSDSIALHLKQSGEDDVEFVEHRPEFSPTLALNYDYFGDVLFIANLKKLKFLDRKNAIDYFLTKKDCPIKINEVLYTTYISHDFEEKMFRQECRHLPAKAINGDNNSTLSLVIPTTFNDILLNSISIQFIENFNRTKELFSSVFQADRLEFFIVYGPEVNKPNLKEFIIKNASHINSNIYLINDLREFNYSQRINLALDRINSDLTFLLNDDVYFKEINQIKKSLVYITQSEVASVGFVMHNSAHLISHAGVKCEKNFIDEYLKSSSSHEIRPDLDFDREVTANTFASVLIRSDMFKNHGNLDENLIIDFNDIEWCLRVSSKGYSHIVVSGEEIMHETSSTRKNQTNKINFVPLLSSIYSLPAKDKYKFTIPYCCYSSKNYIGR